MALYKIEPIRENVKAPALYVDADGNAKESDIIAEAKEKSGLSRFVAWNFSHVKKVWRTKKTKEENEH